MAGSETVGCHAARAAGMQAWIVLVPVLGVLGRPGRAVRKRRRKRTGGSVRPRRFGSGHLRSKNLCRAVQSPSLSRQEAHAYLAYSCIQLRKQAVFGCLVPEPRPHAPRFPDRGLSACVARVQYCLFLLPLFCSCPSCFLSLSPFQFLFFSPLFFFTFVPGPPRPPLRSRLRGPHAREHYFHWRLLAGRDEPSHPALLARSFHTAANHKAPRGRQREAAPQRPPYIANRPSTRHEQ